MDRIQTRAARKSRASFKPEKKSMKRHKGKKKRVWLQQ